MFEVKIDKNNTTVWPYALAYDKSQSTDSQGVPRSVRDSVTGLWLPFPSYLDYGLLGLVPYIWNSLQMTTVNTISVISRYISSFFFISFYPIHLTGVDVHSLSLP